MQVTVPDSVISILKQFATGEFNLAQSEMEELSIFSVRIVKLNKVEKFNKALTELKSTFENEFKDGCYGISCTDCALNDEIQQCMFRQFRSSIFDMELE